MLAEQHIDLSRMFLHVPQVVDQQAQETHFSPPESAALLNFLVGQRLNCRPAGFAAVFEVGQQFSFGIGAFGDRAVLILFDQQERGRRQKAVLGASQIQVKPEERVIGDIPDLRAFGRLPMRLPQRGASQFVGTRAEGCVEIVDHCAELLPDAGFEIGIHLFICLSPRQVFADALILL